MSADHDGHDATKARTENDDVIDSTFDAVLAPTIVAGAAWLAEAFQPGTGVAVSGPATILALRGTAWLRGLGSRFYETCPI